MILRNATTDDTDAIASIAARSAGAALWSRDQYRQLIAMTDEYLVLVVERESQLTGFVIARIIVDEIEIQNIAVELGSRSRGIGSQLVAKTLEIAANRGFGGALLEVRESNIAARNMYEKQGFLEVGRRAKYYSDPEEAAVLYRKNLGPAAPENA
jgi:[ribosomal protein S18]-alanine N-acetyltransferase